jgi:hypothetical protein
VRLDKCCTGSSSGGFLLLLLEIGDPFGLPSSVRNKVRSPLRAEPSIGNVLGFLYWT